MNLSTFRTFQRVQSGRVTCRHVTLDSRQRSTMPRVVTKRLAGVTFKSCSHIRRQVATTVARVYDACHNRVVCERVSPCLKEWQISQGLNDGRNLITAYCSVGWKETVNVQSASVRLGGYSGTWTSMTTAEQSPRACSSDTSSQRSIVCSPGGLSVCL